MFKQKLLLMMTCAALALTACATIEEKMTAQGAIRLDAEQVTNHIVGKTERWSQGGGYYNPDGTLETVWEGSKQSGPYIISDDGEVCYDVRGWKRHCHFYMNDNGSITMIYKGRNVGPRDVLNGNQLATL